MSPNIKCTHILIIYTEHSTGIVYCQPTVSVELVAACEELRELLSALAGVPRYHHTLLGDSVVQFKMVRSNVSTVIHLLDEVRKSPK